MAASHARFRCGATAVLALACAALGACADIEDRPATWSYIHATIIAPNCTTSNCHTDISQAAGISFDDPEDGYRALAGVDCGGSGMANDLVVAGQPELSKLMYLLRGEEIRVMPPDVPLPDTEVEIIELWIEGGAQCN